MSKILDIIILILVAFVVVVNGYQSYQTYQSYQSSAESYYGIDDVKKLIDLQKQQSTTPPAKK